MTMVKVVAPSEVDPPLTNTVSPMGGATAGDAMTGHAAKYPLVDLPLPCARRQEGRDFEGISNNNQYTVCFTVEKEERVVTWLWEKREERLPTSVCCGSRRTDKATTWVGQ